MGTTCAALDRGCKIYVSITCRVTTEHAKLLKVNQKAVGSSKQSIIEVNGKRYDARTGQLVGRPSDTAPKKPKPIHDFARVSTASAHVHKSTQRSQTLMRSGVKRPTPESRPSVKAAKSHTVSDFKPARPVVARGTIPTQAEAERQARAAAIKQNKLVRKFGDMIQPTALQPVASRVEPMPVIKAPMQHGTLALHAPKSKAESLIEKGLRSANAHTAVQHKPHKTRHKRAGRLATYGAGALSALLLVGFIAYQNIPNIAVRYAAARSGVTASLPGYQPAGFGLSNRIKYNPGQITIEYASNTDDRSYTVTQRESNWNSDTLMSNYVATESEQVQRYEDKGRTIYLYGESNATWVSSGVWYDVKGDSQLTSDQLIRIATSM